jgi:hypothetical protein
MAMVTICLAFLLGALSGAVAGVLVGRHLLQSARLAVSDREPIDPEVELQIKQTARQWAEMHNQSGAASLMADKLRLAYVLHRQLERRRGRRWSR